MLSKSVSVIANHINGMAVLALLVKYSLCGFVELRAILVSFDTSNRFCFLVFIPTMMANPCSHREVVEKEVRRYLEPV